MIFRVIGALSVSAVLTLGVTASTATATGAPSRLPSLASSPQRAPAPSPVSFHAWHTRADFGAGDVTGGVRVGFFQGRPALVLAGGSDTGTWTSPQWRPPSAIGDLVASWQAYTSGDSWIETRLSVRIGDRWSVWYRMGDWSFDAQAHPRSSVNHQSDADGKIYTDTYVPGPNGAPSAYRLQVTLHADGANRPRVHQVAATTSLLTGAPVATSTTTLHRAVELSVPRFSQQTHAGEFPAYGGGGEVWCSPTSTAMVLAYWQVGPTAADLASIGSDPSFDSHGRTDPQVVWAALHTWDAAYHGTGNWPFNTAYASAYGLDGSVRQFASLQDVERWIGRGVPVVASLAWDNADTRTDNDLDGAPILASGGHLLVVSGFTGRGDVIVADPAAPSNDSVRRVYQRGQFERDWLNASTGTVYVIQPHRQR
jgi:hypothetical protein